jgi:diacylglycerol O-acyltransferase / wax synthase
MDRMSPLDASFLHVEDAVTHMHIGAVVVFEGPRPTPEEVRAMVAAKLALVPRYRQKVRFVPGGIARPVWVDDPHFRLAYHLRQTALPSPGGDGELRSLVGGIMSQQLDRTKPLWEMWTVEGLSEGHWALVSKIHHCMVDGIAGTDLLALMLDTDPRPTQVEPDRWTPRPEPSADELVVSALVDLARSPGEQLRVVRASLRRPSALVTTLTDLARGLTALGGVARPTTRATLIGPIGPRRRWSWATATLEDVKAVRVGLGGTVNDVVLSAVTLGFRELLSSRGEDLASVTLRCSCPCRFATTLNAASPTTGSRQSSPSSPWASLIPATCSAPYVSRWTD